MNELIEKLKDKNHVRAFGLMSKEEQDCLKKANVDKAVEMYQYPGEWVSGHFWNFNNQQSTYAIKPDYKPEPEYVDLEIVALECSDVGRSGIKWLGVQSCLHRDILPFDFTHLHCLPSLPNFVLFWHKTNDDCNMGGDHLEEIADMINDGKKVYARFRSDK